MNLKSHTEEQIIAILKEQEAGMKTADVCRKHGQRSDVTTGSQARGLEVSDAKRVRRVEDITEALWGDAGVASTAQQEDLRGARAYPARDPAPHPGCGGVSRRSISAQSGCG